MAIPKIIHYCWFGKGEIDEVSKACIESWKRFCPDYEITQWNEDNFDVFANTYAREAYELKKWAFVADYARFVVLRQYGGFYLDTDVELLDSLDPFLDEIAFSASEDNKRISAGVMGTEANGEWVGHMLRYYEDRYFVGNDGRPVLKTIVDIITEMTEEKYGFCMSGDVQRIENVLTVYPAKYFYPKDLYTKKICLTDKTVAIHHFNASWQDDVMKRSIALRKYFPFLSKKWAAHCSKVIAFLQVKGVKNTALQVSEFIKNDKIDE